MMNRAARVIRRWLHDVATTARSKQHAHCMVSMNPTLLHGTHGSSLADFRHTFAGKSGIDALVAYMLGLRNSVDVR